MKKLIFVTGSFPFGNGETFIENEIMILAAIFDKVYIYSSQIKKNNKNIYRKTPENCIVFAGKSKETKNNLIILLNILKKNVLKELPNAFVGGSIIEKMKRVKACCYEYQQTVNSCKNISNFIQTLNLSYNDSIIVYSYWLSTIGAVALSICTEIKKLGFDINCISRAHGFDLFSEISYIKYLPFQKEEIKLFNQIYACSFMGRDYLKQKYPDYANKIYTAHLGVLDRFNGIFPYKNNDEFTIVSCSNVIPIKRVHLIAEALFELRNIKIRWVHFGDGILLEDLKSKLSQLTNNIKCDFFGRVPNIQIYNFYKKNNINLFINVSISEGLPVSIMEAVSFGIPIIATNVGGTSEIVKDKKNGFLLKSDFKINELAEKIQHIYDMSSDAYKEMCISSRNIYEQYFSAINNYNSFANMLIKQLKTKNKK